MSNPILDRLDAAITLTEHCLADCRTGRVDTDGIPISDGTQKAMATWSAVDSLADLEDLTDYREILEELESARRKQVADSSPRETRDQALEAADAHLEDQSYEIHVTLTRAGSQPDPDLDTDRIRIGPDDDELEAIRNAIRDLARNNVICVGDTITVRRPTP